MNPTEKELSKEECLESLKTIEDGTTEIEDYESFPYITFNQFAQEISVLKQLINEHFELKEIIKKHGLENLTLHELDCAFKKMLSYVEENNRLTNFLSQQNEIIKEYQNGEAYKELKESYDELLANAVKLQEGICTCCEHSNPPLKFEELHEKMWVWDNRIKAYLKIKNVIRRNGLIWFYTDGVGILELKFEENRLYRYEVR